MTANELNQTPKQGSQKMKKLFAIDFQTAAFPHEQRVETNIGKFNRMKDHLLECDYEGTREDYTAKMRDLFKTILHDLRALSVLYAKYYGQLGNGGRPFVDGQIEIYSRRFNRFIDRYNDSEWRVVKGLKMPKRFTFCD